MSSKIIGERQVISLDSKRNPKILECAFGHHNLMIRKLKSTGEMIFKCRVCKKFFVYTDWGSKQLRDRYIEIIGMPRDLNIDTISDISGGYSRDTFILWLEVGSLYDYNYNRRKYVIKYNFRFDDKARVSRVFRRVEKGGMFKWE